jgi:hypothetical protein
MEYAGRMATMLAFSVWQPRIAWPFPISGGRWDILANYSVMRLNLSQYISD